MESYFSEHPSQYFMAVGTIGLGLAVYEGAKAVIEQKPVRNKGLMALGVGVALMSAVGLAQEAISPANQQ